jgi:hypothetical protein
MPISSGGWFAVSTASRFTTSAAKLSRARSTCTSAKRCLCLAYGLIFRRECGSCMKSLRHGVRTNRPSCSGATRTTAAHSSADRIRLIRRSSLRRHSGTLAHRTIRAAALHLFVVPACEVAAVAQRSQVLEAVVSALGERHDVVHMQHRSKFVRRTSPAKHAGVIVALEHLES